MLGHLIFPPLPDSDPNTGDVYPTPCNDGRPWKKACPECTFRLSDPQMLGTAYQEKLRVGMPDTLFYCLHRDDNGEHRVCACYAALHPEQAIGRTAAEKMAAERGAV